MSHLRSLFHRLYSPSRIRPPEHPPQAHSSIRLLVAQFTTTSSTLLSNSASNSKHNDIPSFLAYAEESGLNPETSVYRGTLYEYTVSRALFAKNMVLTRCGGRGDRGVDLRGVWHVPIPPSFTISSPPTSASPIIITSDPSLAKDSLPSTAPPPLPPLHTVPTRSFPTFIQCKISTTKPAIIRELNGTLHHTPAFMPTPICNTSDSSDPIDTALEYFSFSTPTSHHLTPTIAILACPTPCTLGAQKALQDSRRPLAYMCISESGIVRQFVWNHALRNVVGSGLGVAPQYRHNSGIPSAIPNLGTETRLVEDKPKEPEPEEASEATGGIEKEIVLTFNGQVVDGILSARERIIQLEKQQLEQELKEREKEAKRVKRLQKKAEKETKIKEQLAAMARERAERREKRRKMKERKEREERREMRRKMKEKEREEREKERERERKRARKRERERLTAFAVTETVVLDGLVLNSAAAFRSVVETVE